MNENPAMHMPVTLLMAIGKAALNVAGVGLVGDAAEIATAAWSYWKKSPDGRLDEIEAIITAGDEEIASAAEHVAAEVAAEQPDPVRMRLANFLKLVPNRIRQTQRRPADLSGRTIRPSLEVSRPEDMVALIPGGFPRFKAGDRPLPGVDWALVELLGIGGFGEVWKARNPHFDSFAPVALKFCIDPETRQRLLRHEAKVLDRVMKHGEHPGIVRLEATYLSAEPPCLQYEFVEGGDLGGLIEDWHRSPEKPSPDRIAGAMRQLAEIVAFAHHLDPPIVHRDLKPANILVQDKGSGEFALKVTDFGIGGIAAARKVAASQVPTIPSDFLSLAVRGSGTMLYASPEQLDGADPEPRDDVHALGVIWYQMLTGDLTRGRPGGTAWRRRFNERGMPAALLDLLESCFEDRDDRPADAAVLEGSLASFLTGPTHDGNGSRSKPGRAPSCPTELVNTIGMKLKSIAAGEFEMGSIDYDNEKPRHPVRISRPFYLGVYPVTQREYLRISRKNPSHFSGNDQLPVENVSWFDAVTFCNSLSQQEGLKPFYIIHGQSVTVPDWNRPGYRLPTEAEWEYACRAHSNTRFPFGDNKSELEQYAWHAANSSGQTHAVGEKRPNAFGIHDMLGNVWEWCWDGYVSTYYGQSPPADPRGPDGGARWVIRGGGWHYDARYARSATRGRGGPGARNDHVGFRAVRAQPPW
jgi:formylglycine-generating enzyme required for sulfatase activity